MTTNREVTMNTVRVVPRILGLIRRFPRMAGRVGVTLATPALTATRRLVLFGALTMPLLLWAPASFAGLTPTYLACNAGPGNPSKPQAYCQTTWIITNAPSNPSSGATSLSSYIGFVNTTQVAGTVPAYLACNQPLGGTPSKPIEVCDGKWVITSVPGGYNGTSLSSFIGYVYTTQVTGTSPVYLACGASAGPKPPAVCPGNWIITNTASSGGTSFSSFIGYVYLVPPVTAFGFSPKYFIGSVIYVPPGQGPSTITYGAGTVTGTTVSTTESWNASASVGLSIGIASITFGEGFGGSTSKSVDMQNTTSASTTYKGPASNSINHDYDQILLFLGVKLNVSVDYLGNITWSPDFSQIPAQGYAETGYPIAVGCLRPNSTIPASQCAATISFLSSAGITSADYPSILGADPFADPSASQVPATSRFVLIDSVNFLPDPTTSTFTYLENNSSTITNSSTTSYSFSVGVSAAFILKTSNTLTITDSSTTSNKTGSTGSSAFTLSLPSAPYSGPSTLFVYVDTIYKTFMFSFVQ